MNHMVLRVQRPEQLPLACILKKMSASKLFDKKIDIEPLRILWSITEVGRSVFHRFVPFTPSKIQSSFNSSVNFSCQVWCDSWHFTDPSASKPLTMSFRGLIQTPLAMMDSDKVMLKLIPITVIILPLMLINRPRLKSIHPKGWTSSFVSEMTAFII